MYKKLRCLLGLHNDQIANRKFVDGWVICYYECEWCGKRSLDVTETGGYDND